MSEIRYATIIPLIGGMTLGNKMAVGHNPEMFLSYEPFVSNDSHIRRYMPDVPYLTINGTNDGFIQESDSNTFKEIIEDGIDFVSAVPPCSGLSMLNKGTTPGSRGSDAAATQWMDKTTHFVLQNIRPKALIGENAPGLFSKLGEGVVDRFNAIAEKYGYSFSMVKTNTLYHGIPQSRSRTFYFFWDSTRSPIMESYDRERLGLWDYLDEIPEWATHMGTGKFHPRDPHLGFLKHKMSVKDFIEQTKWNTVQGWIREENLWEEWATWGEANGFGYPRKRYDYILSKWYKEHSTLPDDGIITVGLWDQTPARVPNDYVNAVIGKNRGRLFHRDGTRFINTREDMHLMGLPHDFEIGIEASHHITQNVPTCTARDWTYEIIKFIKGGLQLSDTSDLRQVNGQQVVARKKKDNIVSKVLF